VSNRTIPQLVQAQSLLGDEQIEIVQAGVSVRTTVNQIAFLGGPTGPVGPTGPASGPTGPTGSPGTSLAGPTGPTGASTAGPTGPTGPNTQTYPQTATESTYSIAVVDTTYEPGWVERYTTNAIPGTTDMTQAFDNAATVALGTPGGTVPLTYGATAPYLVTRTINCTWGSRNNIGGLNIVNVGNVGYDATSSSTPTYGIFAKHTGVAVFDITGVDTCNVTNTMITTHPSVYPSCAFLAARNAVVFNGQTYFGASHPIFRGGTIAGHFGVCCYYNYGAENDMLTDMYFANYSTVANTKIFVATASNASSEITNLSTSFTSDALGQPLVSATGIQSTTNHEWYRNDYAQFGGTDTTDLFYIEGADSVRIGGWGVNAGGRSMVYFDGSISPTSYFNLLLFSCESAAGEVPYGVYYSNDPQTYSYHTIATSKLVVSSNAIYSPNTGAVLNNFTLGNMHAGGAPVFIAGTLENSTADTGYILNIGTSKQNLLIGDYMNWTIGTRNKDRWIGKTATTTFPAGIVNGTNGWTTSGISSQLVYFEFIDRHLKFSIELLASSLEWNSSATIVLAFPSMVGTGISLNCVIDGVCQIVNTGTGALIGMGTIAAGGSTIAMNVAQPSPATSVIISGEYYVS
jgi:hypothetical protein